MRNAQECAPKKCRCGIKLSKPISDYPWPDERWPYLPTFKDVPIKEKVWHIHCICGIVYVWSFHEKSNGCWKIRSAMPLFDSQEIVVIA